jgi:hypothetical protein
MIGQWWCHCDVVAILWYCYCNTVFNVFFIGNSIVLSLPFETSLLCNVVITISFRGILIIKSFLPHCSFSFTLSISGDLLQFAVVTIRIACLHNFRAGCCCDLRVKLLLWLTDWLINWLIATRGCCDLYRLSIELCHCVDWWIDWLQFRAAGTCTDCRWNWWMWKTFMMIDWLELGLLWCVLVNSCQWMWNSPAMIDSLIDQLIHWSSGLLWSLLAVCGTVYCVLNSLNQCCCDLYWLSLYVMAELLASH